MERRCDWMACAGCDVSDSLGGRAWGTTTVRSTAGGMMTCLVAGGVASGSATGSGGGPSPAGVPSGSAPPAGPFPAGPFPAGSSLCSWPAGSRSAGTWPPSSPAPTSSPAPPSSPALPTSPSAGSSTPASPSPGSPPPSSPLERTSLTVSTLAGCHITSINGEPPRPPSAIACRARRSHGPR